jgi:hypothetical protein
MLMVGGSQPDLRALLSGKLRLGRARMGVPRKRSTAPSAMPSLASRSSLTLGLQHPVGFFGATARTTGIGGVAGLRARVAQKVDAVGAAASAKVQKLVLGLQEEAFKALDPQFQFGAAVDRALAADPHMAACVGQVQRCVVGQAVGLYHQAATAELHVTFGQGLQLGLAANALRPQHDGQAPPGVTPRQWLQRGAGGQAGVGLRSARPPHAKPATPSAAARASGVIRMRFGTAADGNGAHGQICRINYP